MVGKQSTALSKDLPLSVFVVPGFELFCKHKYNKESNFESQCGNYAFINAFTFHYAAMQYMHSCKTGRGFAYSYSCQGDGSFSDANKAKN